MIQRFSKLCITGMEHLAFYFFVFYDGFSCKVFT